MHYEGECAVPDCGRPGRDYHFQKFGLQIGEPKIKSEIHNMIGLLYWKHCAKASMKQSAVTCGSPGESPPINRA